MFKDILKILYSLIKHFTLIKSWYNDNNYFNYWLFMRLNELLSSYLDFVCKTIRSVILL